MSGSFRKYSILIFTLLNSFVLSAQGTRYEAEAGTLTGSLTVQNALPGYSGTGYAGRFETDGDKITFNLNLSQGGNFNLYIGYQAPYGEKINKVNINGNTADATFPACTSFREMIFGKIVLPAGSSTINIEKSWGWFLIDYIRIEPNSDPEIAVRLPYQLVTFNPTIETKRLFQYLMDRFGKNIHSGAMSLNAIEEAEWLYSQTGKYPALIGLDFMNHNRDYSWYNKTVVINEAKNWYARNGMVAFNWHWRDPLRVTDEFYTEKTSFDVSKVTDPLSAEYIAMIKDIDIIAGFLKQLQTANVPVIFRPLHEASGKWFWWGAKGPEPCKALWRLMFDRLVNYHGLKNLIWVWTTDTRADNLDWYPGDEYVDILGADIYAANGDFSSQMMAYNRIKDAFKGKKLITLSENGPVPDPDNLVNDNAYWSWFMPWYGDFIRNPSVNPVSHWQKIMNHSYVITLDEMPDLKNYPVKDETVYSSSDQGFFLNSWQPKNLMIQEFNDVPKASEKVTVSVKVNLNDTITKIPQYVFGDNANLWTGTMSDNMSLMKHIADRNIGVLRGPGGSISDVFFWNRNVNQRPADVPSTLPGQTGTDWLWYGDRPYSWENWTMDVDSFYVILKKVNATGMITVNYGYARYGTGTNPVANAAHMAADWVRYDKGRSRYWEIGNEVFGSWEAGYKIDRSLNKDGQPEIINGSLYGQHCLVFIDSMKAAASQIGVNIKIGVVMLDSYSSSMPAWNRDVIAKAGDKADFYVVHSYFTPYNQNSDVSTILNSYSTTGNYKSFVWNAAQLEGKPKLPVALTEYNIFATGSNQAVSHVNGMHAVLVTGEAIKTGYGATLRWDLANGWDNGNDHGMFSSGNEPGVAKYAPRPAFYHLYYLRKFLGDVLLNSTIIGDPDIVIIPTTFHSGHIGTAIVNKGFKQQIVRLNIENFKFGARYYYFTLTGLANTDFSRKVFVNGISNTLDAGGPAAYESIKPNSTLITDEVVIKAPPLSVTYVAVDPGEKELVINEDIVGINDIQESENIRIIPNPTNGRYLISDIPEGINKAEILDTSGRMISSIPLTGNSYSGNTKNDHLNPGLYIIRLSGKGRNLVKKLIVY